MVDNTTQIQMNLIGYNEKGFVGFMTGGHYLSYLETPKNAEELINKLCLPYISHEDVKLTNAWVEEHKDEVDGFNIVELKEGQKNEKRQLRKNDEKSRRKTEEKSNNAGNVQKAKGQK